ncbi:hypothetical protein ACLOJK_038509 [Asimina triloba]
MEREKKGFKIPVAADMVARGGDGGSLPETKKATAMGFLFWMVDLTDFVRHQRLSNRNAAIAVLMIELDLSSGSHRERL